MIFVDADSCEKNAREFILNTAVKKNLKVIFAANKNIPFSFSNPLFKMFQRKKFRRRFYCGKFQAGRYSYNKRLNFGAKNF